MRSRRVKAVLNAIAVNVRERRAACGWTQEQTAEAAGIEARYLQSIEHGRTNLSVDVLVALALALNVEPADLFAPAAKLPPSKPGRPSKRTPTGTTKQAKSAAK